jgi:hypothetical protein
MEREQLQAFNERLSQWISAQGFWFQLRHSMGGGGQSGLVNFVGRAFVLFLIAGIGGWIYLAWRVNSAGFLSDLEAGSQKWFNASDASIKGVERSSGQLGLKRVKITGGEHSFFNTLQAWQVRCDMGLTDGLAGIWNPGQMTIEKLEIDLRSGTDDAESARRQAESMLSSPSTFDLRALTVSDATLQWGFSDKTNGKIQNSQLNAQRTPQGWRLQFEGGTFSQNWIHQARISNLVAIVDDEGVTVESGELALTRDDLPAGQIIFENVVVRGGERPTPSGVLKLSHVPLGAILEPAFNGAIEGSISGTLKLSGSTYSREGIGYAGQITLEKGDRITLRDRVALLPVLSGARSYRRMDFTEGSFVLSMSDGKVDIRDVSLEAPGKSEDVEKVTLEGWLLRRPPTPSEIQAALGVRPTVPSVEQADQPTFSRFSELAPKTKAEIEAERLEKKMSAALEKTPRYEGLLHLGLPGDVFELSSSLQKLFPADEKTGRVNIEVPIEGTFEELTRRQADEIRKHSRRD